jgi:hypothetical protein
MQKVLTIYFVLTITHLQQHIFDHLCQIATMEDPPPVHIDGLAGHGKTYCLYPLIGALRKAGKVVLITALSAFAAKNYPGGCTVHYLYGIPVEENCPYLKSQVVPRSDRATMLLESACHC